MIRVQTRREKKGKGRKSKRVKRETGENSEEGIGGREEGRKKERAKSYEGTRNKK